MWLVTEGMGNGMVFVVGHQFDGATNTTQVGANITANGLTERIATVGTTDTFREARFAVNGSAVPATTDPRWRSFGVECRTADLVPVKILLTPDTVAGYAHGIQGSLQLLRELQNGQRIAIKQPELDATRNGYVMSVKEQVVGQEGDRGIGYEVDVTLEFFDIPASVA